MNERQLLLLHGALGSCAQFELLVPFLQKDFIVYAVNFSGHGGEPIPEEPFCIEHFADNVLRWMNAHAISNVDIFGYSMGGFVGVYLALQHPECVGKVCTLATKFAWDEATAKKEAAMLDPENMLRKVPVFAAQLAQRHAPQDWKVVVRKTAEMMQALGRRNPLATEVLAEVEHPVLVSVGDRDTMVSIEETVNAYRHLKRGQLLIFQNTPHPLEKIDPGRLAAEIHAFMSNDAH